MPSIWLWITFICRPVSVIVFWSWTIPASDSKMLILSRSYHILSYHLLHEVPGISAEGRGWGLEALNPLDCVVYRQQEGEHRVFWKQNQVLSRCCSRFMLLLFAVKIRDLQVCTFTKRNIHLKRIFPNMKFYKQCWNCTLKSLANKTNCRKSLL